MKKRITSSDVAREAGVSRATVSYVLNNVEGARISDDTRKRVLEAAETLGYHMDFIAQAMKTNRSMSIGVVSRRNIAESRFTDVLAGIKEVLSKEQYSILLCSDEMDERGYPEYYRLYLSKKIDGIIFLSYQEQLKVEPVDKHVELMFKEQMPSVFVDYHVDNPMVNSVDINYYHGAYIATKYLIDKGHKSIGLLIPDIDTEQERQRLRAVKKAVEDAGNIDLHIYNAEQNGQAFSENIIETLKDKQAYSALIVAWSLLACHTLYYTNQMGIKVPEDIAVIALAGGGSANFTYPKLSTCDLPLYEAGKKSAQILIDVMHNSELPVNMMLPCVLNIRDSC